LKVVDFAVYTMTPILIILLVYLIINIIRKNNKKILISILLIVFIILSLTVYYFPKKNIIEDYKFTYMRIDLPKIQNKKIKSQENIDDILNIINNHTFTRTTTAILDGVKFQSSDVITISTSDFDTGTIIHLYIIKDKPKDSMIQINSKYYNIKGNINDEIIEIIDNILDIEK